MFSSAQPSRIQLRKETYLSLMVHGSLPSCYCLVVRLCPVPRPHYSARRTCFGSDVCTVVMSYVVNMSSDVMRYAGQSGHAMYRGSRGNMVRSSRIRHQNALTEKAWEDAVQGLGNIRLRLSIVWT